MMRTEAPKDLAGRGFVNFARTTPELPANVSLAQRAGTDMMAVCAYRVVSSLSPR